MKAQQRIDNISEVVRSRGWLTGRKFRVIFDEKADTMTVEFLELTAAEIERLRGYMNTLGLNHVFLQAKTIIAEKPRHEHGKRNDRGPHGQSVK